VGPVIIYCDENFSAERKRLLENAGATVVPVSSQVAKLDLHKVLYDLAVNRGVQDLFVEGGPQVLGSFLQENYLIISLFYCS